MPMRVVMSYAIGLGNINSYRKVWKDILSKSIKL